MENRESLTKNGTLKCIVITIVALVVGFVGGRQTAPTKVVVKKEEVIKEVESSKDKTKVVEKEVIKPDGTIIKKKVAKAVKEKKAERESTVKVTKIEESYKPQWKVGALTGIQGGSVGIVGMQVERRIVGPVFLGVTGNWHSRDIYLNISIEF